jgi:hypothetical protein
MRQKTRNIRVDVCIPRGVFPKADTAFRVDEILGAIPLHRQFRVFNIEIIKSHSGTWNWFRVVGSTYPELTAECSQYVITIQHMTKLKRIAKRSCGHRFSC